MSHRVSGEHNIAGSCASVAEMDKLDSRVAAHHEAIITAIGSDGKNGRLSRLTKDHERFVGKVDDDLKSLVTRMESAKRYVIGMVFTLLLSIGSQGYQSCVSQREINARMDERLKIIEAQASHRLNHQSP